MDAIIRGGGENGSTAACFLTSIVLPFPLFFVHCPFRPTRL
jgi:hypothetical protein